MMKLKEALLRFVNSKILSSSVVERSTVNRVVVGSKPTWGEFTQKLCEIYTHLSLSYKMKNKFRPNLSRIEEPSQQRWLGFYTKQGLSRASKAGYFSQIFLMLMLIRRQHM